ncbi:MAG: enoyl-CoA hydratase-related protein [Amphritea sp.]|nr:enoyl-CoA hydratase-related protein [Amphritea sp.]
MNAELSGVRSEVRDATLILTLDRPSANAINSDVSRSLYSALASFEADDSLQVAIITGQGERFFSAGWDLNAGEAVDEDHGPGGFAGLTEFFDITKPVIGAVNGMAVGGGLELLLACDLIVAAEHAEFFLPEGQIGIAPDSGGVFRLPKRLPRPLAMDMMLTGKRLSADEALRWGMINRVVSADRLLTVAQEMSDAVQRSAPLAQRAIKELVNMGESRSVADAFVEQRQGDLPCYQRMLKSEDAVEGSRAFAERREPVWEGC